MRIEPVLLEQFAPNSYFENLIRLRDTKPETFAILSDSEKFSLEIYEEMKEKYANTKSNTMPKHN